MPTRQPTKKKKPNRVQAIQALDRFTTNPNVARRGSNVAGRGTNAAGRGTVPGAARPPVRPGQPPAGQPQVSQPFTPPMGQHPFLPGESLGHVVGASASQPGSPPGSPNIGAAVMRSFQPSVLERTPLVSSGAGVPNQQPNSQYNFGGQQLPPGVRGMVPQRSGGTY